jgi:hypothetical protein
MKKIVRLTAMAVILGMGSPLAWADTTGGIIASGPAQIVTPVATPHRHHHHNTTQVATATGLAGGTVVGMAAPTATPGALIIGTAINTAPVATPTPAAP